MSSFCSSYACTECTAQTCHCREFSRIMAPVRLVSPSPRDILLAVAELRGRRSTSLQLLSEPRGFFCCRSHCNRWTPVQRSRQLSRRSWVSGFRSWLILPGVGCNSSCSEEEQRDIVEGAEKTECPIACNLKVLRYVTG